MLLCTHTYNVYTEAERHKLLFVISLKRIQEILVFEIQNLALHTCGFPDTVHRIDFVYDQNSHIRNWQAK